MNQLNSKALPRSISVLIQGGGQLHYEVGGLRGQQANQLQHQTLKVTGAKAGLEAEIKKDSSWADIVSSVNSLLATVDQAVQVAKGVMI